MSVYLLQSNADGAGRTAVTGADACVVVAHNAADARAVAKAQFTGVSPGAWDSADCMEIVEPSDCEGFTMVCAVADDGETVAEVTVTGKASDDLDSLGVKCAKALNDCEAIQGAAYNNNEHVLTVASAAGGDDLGHCKVYCVVLPAGVTAGGVPGIPGCVKAVVDQGQSVDSLTVVLAGPEYTLPCKVVAFGSGS
jgi:hypothetical protein